MVRLTRVGLWLTFISSLLGVLTLIFVGLQWHEMHSAGKQLDRQIEIAGIQAQAALVQAKASRTVARSAMLQVDALNDQVDIARQGLGINRRGVSVAEQQERDQQAIHARQLSNATLYLDPLPLTLSEGVVPDTHFRLVNGSSGTVGVRRLYMRYGLVETSSSSGTPPDLGRLLASAPSHRFSIDQGSQEPFIAHFLVVPTAQMVAAFAAGTVTLQLYVAIEFVDAAGNLHHRYDCARVVTLPPSGRISSQCDAPPND